MRIGKDMIKQAEAQFLMDCALPPESAGTRQGYLIGKKPGMPEQDFMTDVSYGYLVRECMEKAAAGLDYGIASRARVYQGMDLFFRAVLFCGKGYLLADDAIYDWCCREYQEGGVAPEWFCQFSNLRRLDRQLARFGRRIADTHIYFLPGGKEEAALPPSLKSDGMKRTSLRTGRKGRPSAMPYAARS